MKAGEGLCRKVLWTGGAGDSKKGLVAWDSVCRPKVGGLNLLSPSNMEEGDDDEATLGSMGKQALNTVGARVLHQGCSAYVYAQAC